jgi:sporulation protein YlmC with PRC-barrel domain
MQPEYLDTPLRASTLLGRQVRDRDGHVLGRVADLETTRDADGHERINAAVVTSGRWGRLLGYERDETTGPWLLQKAAHYVLRRHTHRVPLNDLML